MDTHSRTPRLKTCQELGLVEFAPTKADPELAGETTTLSGTPVRTTFPLTMRQPFLMTGTAVIVIFYYLQMKKMWTMIKLLQFTKARKLP